MAELKRSAVEHWEEVFAKGLYDAYSVVTPPDEKDPIFPVLQAAVRHFGDLRGRRLLDLGCGRGSSSLFFAELGADVIAVDISPSAIANLRNYCARHRIENVTGVCSAALDLVLHDPVDFVFGSMILHHIEPFDRFASVLRNLLDRDGKAFFFENSAQSDVLIWFRQNVVGRFGVPKHGDEEEFPLMESEIDDLRRLFDVRVVYPELYFFRLISMYLLRGRLSKPFLKLDELLYPYPAVRRLSYRQYLYLS